PGKVVTLGEHLRDRIESRRHDRERRRIRGGGDNAREPAALELVAAAEQHLALVREVAEEGALGEPRALGDLGDGRRLVSLLVEQLDRGAHQAALGVWSPA